MKFSLDTSVFPKWAKPALQKVQKSLEAAKSGDTPPADSFQVQKLTPDQAMSHLVAARGSFSEFSSYDEDPERDKALGEKGVAETPWGTARLNGNSRNGSMTIEADGRATSSSLNGGEVEQIRILENGYVHATSLNLNTGEGYRIQVLPETQPNELPKSEHTQAVTNGAKALSSLPKDSDESLLAEVFLDGSKSLIEARSKVMTNVGSQVAELGDPTLTKLMAEPNGHTPRKAHDRLLKLRQEDPDNAQLKKLSDDVGWWQVLEDFPKLKADGLLRTTEYYVSPQALQLSTAAQNWEFDKKTGLPIADTVVVGGGPGGLATTYHMADKGHRTLLFESGNIGQSFSDASAKSVHQLRTDEDSTDLIYTPNHQRLGVDVSLGRNGDLLEEQALDARQDWYAAQDETPHGFIKNSQTTTTNPVSRAQLFGHMSQIADGLATRYPDTFVCEKSPVSGFEKVERDGETLVKVTTARGHQVLTRGLVVSTGFVGDMGDNARTLQQYSELESQNSSVVVLGSDHDLIAKNDKIADSHVVISDRLLGRPETREMIKGLPEGSHVAVKGGGESAVKGALEVLHTNPGVNVDLYTSKPLEPYQTQVPAHILDRSAAELAIRDAGFSSKTMQTLEGFGTPITSESLRELMELEAKGRVRIREMGKRFNKDTVDVNITSDGFGMSVKDPEVKASLRKQRKEWQDLGMYSKVPAGGPADELPTAQMVIMAVGYDTRKAQAGPLIQDLAEAGLVELKDGMPVLGDDGMSSAQNPLVSFNTAAVVKMGSDTTLQARAVRGYRLAEKYTEMLPQRDEPTDRITKDLPLGSLPTNNPEELWTRTQNLEQARSALENGHWDDDLIDFHQSRIDKIEDPEAKKRASRSIELRQKFPGQNGNLILLARRGDEFPESLSPAENLLLKRAFEISDRTHQPLEGT